MITTASLFIGLCLALYSITILISPKIFIERLKKPFYLYSAGLVELGFAAGIIVFLVQGPGRPPVLTMIMWILAIGMLAEGIAYSVMKKSRLVKYVSRISNPSILVTAAVLQFIVGLCLVLLSV